MENNRVVPDFSVVIFNASAVFVLEETLTKSPSSFDAISPELETDLRIAGCELIQTAGQLLKLPQPTIARGQTMYHRFFYTTSFLQQDFQSMAAACTLLACKVTENVRNPDDILNVFHHMKQFRIKGPMGPNHFCSFFMPWFNRKGSYA